MTFYKNNRKNNLSKSSLSQYVMWFPNAAEIHGDLYGEPGGVGPRWSRKWNPKSFSYLKVLKGWKYLILSCSIPRECPKISELPLQKIPWKITDLNKNFVTLEIIISISSLNNEEISFVLLSKLWTICAMSIKSIR